MCRRCRSCTTNSFPSSLSRVDGTPRLLRARHHCVYPYSGGFRNTNDDGDTPSTRSCSWARSSRSRLPRSGAYARVGGLVAAVRHDPRRPHGYRHGKRRSTLSAPRPPRHELCLLTAPRMTRFFRGSSRAATLATRRAAKAATRGRWPASARCTRPRSKRSRPNAARASYSAGSAAVARPPRRRRRTTTTTAATTRPRMRAKRISRRTAPRHARRARGPVRYARCSRHRSTWSLSRPTRTRRPSAIIAMTRDTTAGATTAANGALIAPTTPQPRTSAAADDEAQRRRQRRPRAPRAARRCGRTARCSR